MDKGQIINPNSMNQYPYILIPDVLHNLQIRQWENLKEPSVPIEPLPPNPPMIPQRIHFLELLIFLVIGSIFSWLLGMIYSSLLYTGIGVTFLLIFVRYFQQIKSFSQKIAQYKADLSYFRFQQDNYSANLEKFKQQQINYRKLRQEFANQSIINQQIKTHNYHQLQTRLSDLVTFEGINSKAKKGLSEPKFEIYLKRFFGRNIRTKLSIQNPAYSNNYHYTPDFTYLDKETNLHIDIEVDEPYHYTKKFPIHFLELETQQIRDNFFLDCLWIVIRFSEKQVVTSPKSCCKEIAKLILKLTGNLSILHLLKDENDLEPIERWTEEEAIVMANNNYRNSYLSSPFDNIWD